MAVQEQRRKLRAEDAPEAEMNKLFHYTTDYTEHLLQSSEYYNTVGAFEGANYQGKGYYRPEENCVMFTRVSYFCLVCREAIDRIIDEYTLGD